ncbi:protein FAR1-RELATED SEQUENCE 5-like [Miscanthus floridulus]|uniref:protein FAR1-RELATED SEQUENCE 5-like n=1 Tax=Miscanthus floridulus TaxID=154761 RepID=UPI00345897D2
MLVISRAYHYSPRPLPDPRPTPWSRLALALSIARRPDPARAVAFTKAATAAAALAWRRAGLPSPALPCSYPSDRCPALSLPLAAAGASSRRRPSRAAAPAPSARATVIASIAAFVESAGFSRTLVALQSKASLKEEMSDDDSLLEYSEIVMKIFGSEDDGFEFYNNYAYEKGFSVRKKYYEWDNGHNERTLWKFVCSYEGFRAEKEVRREIKKRRPRNITCCGCRAQLVITQDPKTEQWYVKDFIDEHNHPMTEPDLACFLRSHRRISDDQKAEIVQLQISRIRKHQIMDIMVRWYGGYDKVGFTSRALYNFCHRNKAETLFGGDARIIISYMIESKHRDPDFFFQYKTDGRGHLMGLLWCDFQCQMDYRAFGDVIVFDGTYKTNRYNLTLVSFVGVNHHKSTILFACGILSHEDTESYVWLLRSFCDAMIQKHPVSMITDGDHAMKKAISIVWPNSSHRLCVWHIEGIARNLHTQDMKDKVRGFLYDRCSIENIERKWIAFLVKEKVIDKDSWLYQMYEMREI